MNKPPPANAAEHLKAAAREIVAANDPDPVGALFKRQKDLFESDQDELAISISEELERLGAQRAIALARREASSVPRVHETTPGIGAQVVRRGPYGWMLPNGSHLNMATVADIEDAIARHKVKALAHAGWVKFYAAVKAKMVAAKVHSVGELFSEPELLQLGTVNGVNSSAESEVS